MLDGSRFSPPARSLGRGQRDFLFDTRRHIRSNQVPPAGRGRQFSWSHFATLREGGPMVEPNRREKPQAAEVPDPRREGRAENWQGYDPEILTILLDESAGGCLDEDMDCPARTPPAKEFDGE